MKKKIVVCLSALFLLSSASFAQKGKDHITMKADGKVYWVRGGESIRMLIDVPLKNGSVVNYRGDVKASNGETIMLSKGDKIMMDGTLVKSKKRK